MAKASPTASKGLSASPPRTRSQSKTPPPPSPKQKKAVKGPSNMSPIRKRTLSAAETRAQETAAKQKRREQALEKALRQREAAQAKEEDQGFFPRRKNEFASSIFTPHTGSGAGTDRTRRLGPDDIMPNNGRTRAQAAEVFREAVRFVTQWIQDNLGDTEDEGFEEAIEDLQDAQETLRRIASPVPKKISRYGVGRMKPEEEKPVEGKKPSEKAKPSEKTEDVAKTKPIEKKKTVEKKKAVKKETRVKKKTPMGKHKPLGFIDSLLQG